MEHVRERVSALEDSAAGWSETGERLEHFRDEYRSLIQFGAEQVEEVGSRLSALRAEDASILATLADLEGRHSRVESALERFEASQEEERRDFAARSEKWEARTIASRGETEALRERLRQIADDQSGRVGQLEAYLGRIAAVESDASVLRGELEALRLEHEATTRDILDRAERSRREIEALRAGSESQGLFSSPKAVEQDDVRGLSKGTRTPTTPSLGRPDSASPRIECDGLAEDLVRDRLVGDGRHSAVEATAIAAAATTSRSTGSAASHLSAVELKGCVDLYVHCMQFGQFVDAAIAARRLVVDSRDRMGADSLEHALWLRNLAFSLSKVGVRDEAQESFHRALDICRMYSLSNRVPLATCLLDISEFHLEAGDGRSAKVFCEEATAVLEADPSTGSPLRERVRKCMDRIGAIGPLPSAVDMVPTSE
jgi:hypothetical protein